MVKIFEREFELENGLGVLVLSQLEEGDVHCVVWDAALVLAKYLECRSSRDPKWLQEKRTVELGAGLGCVGLVAACYGAHVTVTDQGKALPLLEHNLNRNGEILQSLHCKIDAKGIDWREESMETQCDLLLLADCVYYRESIRPLVKTMAQLSTPETEILLSQEDRSYSALQSEVWEEFYREVKTYFEISLIPREEQHKEYSSPDIKLMRLKKHD